MANWNVIVVNETEIISIMKKQTRTACSEFTIDFPNTFSTNCENVHINDFRLRLMCTRSVCGAREYKNGDNLYRNIKILFFCISYIKFITNFVPKICHSKYIYIYIYFIHRANIRLLSRFVSIWMIFDPCSFVPNSKI